jgi:hypothetical protein
MTPTISKREGGMPKATELVLVEEVEPRILQIRGNKVILDRDLAELYGVTTKRLNEQVRRNKQRFPPDFMFQLRSDEIADLRSQNATSSSRHGGRRYAPYAFTEHGAIMVASVLNTARAVARALPAPPPHAEAGGKDFAPLVRKSKIRSKAEA